MRYSTRAIVAVLLIWSMTGCNSKPYELAPVSGKVSFEGKPLSGGVVNFQPIATGDSKSVGPGSTAKCDGEGRFTLRTADDAKGAVVGKHTVRIYSFSAETAGNSDADDGRVETIPHKFNYRSTLTFEVSPDGTEAADFDLTKK